MQKVKSPPLTPDEANRRLRDIGRLELDLQHVTADMNRAIDNARAHYTPMIEMRVAKLAQLKKELRLACEDSRRDLLPGKRKTLDLIFGKIGWRNQPAVVKMQVGITPYQVVSRLVRLGRADLVRVRKDPEKQTIKAALADGSLTADMLDAAGLRLVQGREDWFYEVDHEKVLRLMED